MRRDVATPRLRPAALTGGDGLLRREKKMRGSPLVFPRPLTMFLHVACVFTPMCGRSRRVSLIVSSADSQIVLVVNLHWRVCYSYFSSWQLFQQIFFFHGIHGICLSSAWSSWEKWLCSAWLCLSAFTAHRQSVSVILVCHAFPPRSDSRTFCVNSRSHFGWCFFPVFTHLQPVFACLFALPWFAQMALIALVRFGLSLIHCIHSCKLAVIRLWEQKRIPRCPEKSSDKSNYKVLILVLANTQINSRKETWGHW